MTVSLSLRRLAAAVAGIALLAACGDDGGSGSPVEGTGTELAGLFSLVPGDCSAGEPTGSYFRMVQPGGTPEAGPFVDNVDSSCPDTTFTPLVPGSDGGLRSGSYQPQPEPAFDDANTSLAGAVITPQPFFAVGFGISTNEIDPQTGTPTPVPAIRAIDGTLTGDLSALSVSWNGQHFNQGAPKPGADEGGDDGAGPALTGTYDAATGAYTLDWSSLIGGGPFDGFTGLWHFEGAFTAS